MKKRTLKNGLRLITIPLKNTKVVTVLILVKTGSKNEEARVSGISHFLEHMFFKGTAKRKTFLEITEEIDRVGGACNAFTGEECTGYYAKVNVDHLYLAIEWVADIYLNSTLPEKEMEKEKGVIKEEINMYNDNPMDKCYRAFQALLYGDQPAGRDIAGTKETVSSITRKDLLDYMESQYVAKNTVVVVTGNIKEKEVTEEIEKIFSKMRNHEPQQALLVTEKQEKPEVLIFHKETDQTHFCLGVRTFNIFHSERYTQAVSAALLGGMMSSRLFSKIVDNLGLAYYIKTGVDDNSDTGFLATRAGVDNKKTKDAIEAIVKEYKRMKREKISPKELKKAKEHLKGKLSISLESSDMLAYFHGMNELLEGREYRLEDVFKSIDKVTATDIQKMAKEVFRKNNINLAIVGPQKNKKAFEDILKKI